MNIKVKSSNAHNSYLKQILLLQLTQCKYCYFQYHIKQIASYNKTFYQSIFITHYQTHLFHFIYTRMRPQSAQQPHTVLFNQLSGQYYTLSSQGKQIPVNKRGDLATKFTNDFTGFFNFKQRKHRSIKDKAHMYTEPKLQYEKENAFVNPTGTKFLGYAQSPYNLKGEIVQFLGGSTFKQTVDKNQSKSINTRDSVASTSHNNSTVSQQKTVNKFKSVKLFRKNNASELNFDLIKDKLEDRSCGQEWNKLLMKRQCKGDTLGKSIILRAGEKYSSVTHKRIKSTNASSAPSLHRSTNSHNSTHQKTYFQQSLSNIQRTQNPNYLHSDFTYGQFSGNTFNQSSVKGKCYKSSCHYGQYMPKRRYVKERNESNTVGIGEYQEGLEAERKEKQLVNRLREELKIYQPVVVEAQVKKEEKAGDKDKDKGKKQGVQGKK